MSNREDKIGTQRAHEYVGPLCEAWTAYAHEIADNGLDADARQVLLIAPGYCEVEQWVYVTTNGDPIVLGWIHSEEGYIELDENETTLSRLLPDGDLAWTREHLETYGFELPNAD